MAKYRSKNWSSLSEVDQLSDAVDFEASESRGRYPSTDSSRLIRDIAESLKETNRFPIDPERAWSDSDRVRRSLDPGMIADRLFDDKRAAVGDYLTGALGSAGLVGAGAIGAAVGPAEAAFQGAAGATYDKALDTGLNAVTAGDPQASAGEQAGVLGALALAAVALYQARKGNLSGVGKAGSSAVAGLRRVYQNLVKKVTGRTVSAAAAEAAVGEAAATKGAEAAGKSILGRIFGSTTGQLVGGAIGVASLPSMIGQVKEMKEAGEDFRAMMPWAGEGYKPTSELRLDIAAADQRIALGQAELEKERAFQRTKQREDAKAAALTQAQWDTWKFGMNTEMLKRYHEATGNEMQDLGELLLQTYK